MPSSDLGIVISGFKVIPVEVDVCLAVIPEVYALIVELLALVQEFVLHVGNESQASQFHAQGIVMVFLDGFCKARSSIVMEHDPCISQVVFDEILGVVGGGTVLHDP